MDWPVLRYFLDATIWFMLVSVTASTWRMLAWNCSAPSPPSCHWICRGVIYKTREWQPLVTTRDSVISHLLNVQILLTWDYRYVGINLHTFLHGGEVGQEMEWSRRGVGGGATSSCPFEPVCTEFVVGLKLKNTIDMYAQEICEVGELTWVRLIV